MISVFQLLCINRKRNFLLCKYHHVDDKWKKIIQFGKKSEVICRFIRLYLVPLPPYFKVGKEVESVSIYIRGWRDVRTQKQHFSSTRQLRKFK